MAEIRTTFSGVDIERSSSLRRDPAALAALWSDPATRFLPVWEARCLIRDGGAARVAATELGDHLPPAARAIYLGAQAGTHLYAVPVGGRDEPTDLRGAGRFAGLRELISDIPEADAGLLGYARAMVNWHRQHAHCSLCGAPNASLEGGFVLECTVPACRHRSFPRLDPAIIVLVHEEGRCLLGRQPSWPERRFSTIAGFVEPGESLEDAVRREVEEETNVCVAECHYVASQPWPFPASLMIGFHATPAGARAISLNDGELAEARWFTRAELAAGACVLPPRASVAWKLIEAWFDEVQGPRLASLHPDGAFLRPPGQPPESA